MSTIKFILLGVTACILSMVILTQFMDPETALIFSPVAVIIIVTVLLLFSRALQNIRAKIVESKATDITNQVHDKRETARYNVDHYPGEVTMPGGTKISVLLNNVSSGGFQVLCAETAGQNLSQKIGQLKKNKASKVELTANIPFKERVEQIKANCKLAYIAKNEDKIEETPFVAGLEVIESKDKSDQTLERLILGQALAAA